MFGQSDVQKAIVNEIVVLARDGKWRVRLGIIEHIPTLAVQLGREFFDSRLFSLCIAWLTDDGRITPLVHSLHTFALSVYEIRQAAAVNLKRLASKFGTDWVLNTVLPKVVALAASRNYLHRLTCLSCINELYNTLDQERIIDELFPTIRKVSQNSRFYGFIGVKCVIFQLAWDPVPNIRFNVAKTLAKVGTALNSR